MYTDKKKDNMEEYFVKLRSEVNCFLGILKFFFLIAKHFVNLAGMDLKAC